MYTGLPVLGRSVTLNLLAVRKGWADLPLAKAPYTSGQKKNIFILYCQSKDWSCGPRGQCDKQVYINCITIHTCIIYIITNDWFIMVSKFPPPKKLTTAKQNSNKPVPSQEPCQWLNLFISFRFSLSFEEFSVDGRSLLVLSLFIWFIILC